MHVAERERDGATAALAALRAETDARPAAPPHRRAERDPSAGAPFYELVEVSPEVDAAAAANIEAALEASGILDAWVTPDGTLRHTTTGDVVVVPGAGGAPTGSTLHGALIASVAPSSPVAPVTVERILDAIGIDDGTTRIGHDGQWRIGVLGGARREGGGRVPRRWRTRGHTRARRIASAQAALDEADAALDSSVTRAGCGDAGA